MRCIDEVVSELEGDGWLVNQTRMWLASHWTVRNSVGWLHGQERMHRELIDGSRAANLLGWQWTVGAGTGKPYGFAKWQVSEPLGSALAARSGQTVRSRTSRVRFRLTNLTEIQ
jgi:deoxyribodipyrimidine photo-lyase